jgi:hypothetical protein
MCTVMMGVRNYGRENFWSKFKEITDLKSYTEFSCPTSSTHSDLSN